MWRQTTLEVRTGSRTEFVDLTPEVADFVRESGAGNGACTIYSPHTTASVTIQENADPNVVRDMLMEINKVIPFEDGYRHASGNSAAHIKSALIGPSETVPVRDGRLQLGRWQGIYFCEWDGPRHRQIVLTLWGE